MGVGDGPGISYFRLTADETFARCGAAPRRSSWRHEKANRRAVVVERGVLSLSTGSFTLDGHARFAADPWTAALHIIGATAFALALQLKPRVMVLDVMMPGGIDGLQVARQVKGTAELNHTKIVMLSAQFSQGGSSASCASAAAGRTAIAAARRRCSNVIVFPSLSGGRAYMPTG